jgi:uncharacterized protein (TIGR02145 family)
MRKLIIFIISFILLSSFVSAACSIAVPTDCTTQTACDSINGTFWNSTCYDMKSNLVSYWSFDINGTDDYGFKALPAGCRTNNGDFTAIDTGVTFWSSTSAILGKYGWTHAFRDCKDNVYRYYYQSKNIGFSVRCLKD